MTTALLQRSRAFVRLGGVSVDVLTFDTRPDYARVESELRERGVLVDGMRVLNLYDWLRSNPLPGGSLRLDRHPFTPDHPGVRNHYRADGTLLFSDRRGAAGDRSFVLCDESGTPVRSWGRIHHLYRAWLDALSEDEPTWMIVDSKTTANFMMRYRRPHVTTVHVVHNSHLGAGGLRSSRRAVFENLDAFDAVVVLTDRQRRDVRALPGDVSGISVVPNAVTRAAERRTERDPRHGVVLASLTARKRVDHAIRAAAAAGASLDVYGDGARRETLQALAATVPGVALRGHVSDARVALESASFLLATGSSEGFPLVLVEAMAAGCIPIAYDVDYGPADLIDGRNGILVPGGDERALASAIAGLLAETPDELEARRRHARRTAARFSDAAITARWARVLRSAGRRHARRFTRLAASRSLSPLAALASLLPSPR